MTVKELLNACENYINNFDIIDRDVARPERFRVGAIPKIYFNSQVEKFTIYSECELMRILLKED